MSTRGCVAIKNKSGKGWKGVYNHSDSYPTCLGRDVWKHLQSKDVDAFAKELLTYDDWRDYLAEGICPYCGKKGLGQPHSISCGIYGCESGTYPDPEAKGHKHSGMERPYLFTEKNADPLSIEWLYVIDPAKRTMKIFCNESDGKEYKLKGKDGKMYEERQRKDGFTQYFHCAYRHVEVCEASLDGLEPVWERIEASSN